jgi:two-component system chemotaxis response regulator CheB
MLTKSGTLALATQQIMTNDKPLRLLIADPDGKRLAMLLGVASIRPDIQVVGASTIAEVYRQCEALMPQRIALASEFSRINSLQEMSTLFGMIGAEVVVFDSDIRRFMEKVVPPERPAMAVKRPSPPTEQPAHKLAKPLAEKPPARSPLPARLLPKRPSLESVKQMPQPATAAPGTRPDIVAIGASTGGITAIEKILMSFPADCPPTLVVQHIHPGFAEGLVRRLDGLVRPKVITGEDGVELHGGQICFAAASDRHLTVISRAGLRIKLVDAPAVSGHRPSVDALFQSLAAVSDRFRIAACLLTGMGADGADSMVKLRGAGAFTVAQDKETSVVWGMPQAAILRGGADVVLPLDQIASALLTSRAPALHSGSIVR